MRKRILSSMLVLLLACFTASALDNMGITADDIQFDTTTNLSRALGNVKITYEDIFMYADEVTLNQQTMDFTAVGFVYISKGDDGRVWESLSPVKGNLLKKTFEFGPFRCYDDAWYIHSTSGTYNEKGQLTLKNTKITTCDKKTDVHYHAGASQVTFDKNQNFTAKNMTLQFFSLPVMYFPYFSGSLHDTKNFIFKPAYSSKNGLEVRFGYYWTLPEKKGEVIVYTDLMTKQGPGFGAEANYRDEKQEFDFLAYSIKDRDNPSTDDIAEDYNRRFKTEDQRHRVNFYYRRILGEGLNLRMNLDWLSDIDMLEDWYKDTYSDIKQPKSYITLTYDQEYYNFSINVRPRVNDFYTVVETLPEVKLSIPRVSLESMGLPWLMYQSDTMFGYYSMKWRDFDLQRWKAVDYDPTYEEECYQDNGNYSAFRFHTQHFLYMPIDLNYVGILTPRAGFAYTAYSKSSKNKITGEDLLYMLDADEPDNPTGNSPAKHYDSDGGSVGRLALEFGLELKNRYYSDWAPIECPLLGIDGVQHVLEPYINYTFMPDPSEDRDHLYYFDEIDRLYEQNFVRFGLDQHWLTKDNSSSGHKTREFLRMQAYIDRHFCHAEEQKESSGNVGGRVEFKPHSKFSVWTTVLYDAASGNVGREENGFRIGAEDELNFSISYIYRNSLYTRSVYSLGSTLVDITGESSYLKKYYDSSETIKTEINLPINSVTKARAKVEFDFKGHQMASQTYEIRRKLHCWTLVSGIHWDINQATAYVSMELTRFPSVNLSYKHE